MPWLPPFLIGLALWSCAAWAAHPRELWDVPAFWTVWGAAVLTTAVLAALRPDQVLRQTALVFVPLLLVLAVTGLANGGGAGLMPLGLLAVLALALPAWALAAVTALLRRSG